MQLDRPLNQSTWRPWTLGGFLFLAVGSLLGLGCDDEPRPKAPQPVAIAKPEPSVSVVARAEAEGVDASGGSTPAPRCPEGMQFVAGGEFWMGQPEGEGPDDESPRFQTRVADFCMDRTEVTAAKYFECIERGDCTEPRDERVTCNRNSARRSQHPINCIDWTQAQNYCEQRGTRLPTEVEWEYAARGGAEHRKYSWGAEPPDGRTCWKRAHSCKVGSYAAGAFGLYDMIGNVWEWTLDYYGSYPWPPVTSPTRVYRGGSWSRRFEKWMTPTLRNRFGPKRFGSHLGFRCAKLAADASCPYGEAENDQCRHGLEALDCTPPRAFNGLRCALPGAPKCQPPLRPIAGHGCSMGAGAPRPKRSRSLEQIAADVKRLRAPSFDTDCREFQAERPQAYRFEGGTHRARNLVANRMGCKNRDVGVGWNSACCP